MRKFALFLTLFASPVVAQVYQIVTSIAPVQGVVAEITEGRQTPVLLVPPGSDPHDFALRPSQIRALQNADLIVLAGNGMEPWWDAVSGLVPDDAIVVNLADTPNIDFLVMPLRGGAGVDPHLWLDPVLIALAAMDLTMRLTELDPAGEAQYFENLDRMMVGLTAADQRAKQSLRVLDGVQLVMGHDSLQYYERAYGLQFGGALSDGHGNEAGAQGVATIATLSGPRCLVIDVNEADDHGHAVLDGAPIVRVDPLGAAFLGQPGFLGALYSDLARALAGCAPN